MLKNVAIVVDHKRLPTEIVPSMRQSKNRNWNNEFNGPKQIPTPSPHLWLKALKTYLNKLYQRFEPRTSKPRKYKRPNLQFGRASPYTDSNGEPIYGLDANHDG